MHAVVKIKAKQRTLKIESSSVGIETGSQWGDSYMSEWEVDCAQWPLLTTFSLSESHPGKEGSKEELKKEEEEE